MFAVRLLVIFMVILEASTRLQEQDTGHTASEAEIHTRPGSNPHLTLIRARYYYLHTLFSVEGLATPKLLLSPLFSHLWW